MLVGCIIEQTHGPVLRHFTSKAENPRLLSQPRCCARRVTLLVGESRSFRLVNQNGQLQRNFTWTVPDPDAIRTNGGDELTITSKQVGNFRVSA